jgi:hypothetical protein
MQDQGLVEIQVDFQPQPLPEQFMMEQAWLHQLKAVELLVMLELQWDLVLEL